MKTIVFPTGLPDRQATGAWFEQIGRILLCFLILAILGSIAAGIARALLEVRCALLSLTQSAPVRDTGRPVLMILRILAIRFSPNRRQLCDGL